MSEMSNLAAATWSWLRKSAPSLIARHWIILAILLAFVMLGNTYRSSTPVFEAQGELWHYAYVSRLAGGQALRLRSGQDLPPLSISDDAWEQGEAPQPPLYYAVGALLTRRMGADPVESQYQRNPYAALGDPRSVGNKNAVLHLDGEERPYRGVARAIHALRRFSLFCSALTVLLTYCLARELAPWNRSLAAGAASLVAFNPRFLFVSASATNEALGILLATLALYLATRISNGKGDPYRAPLALGISVGLASLTQPIGLATALLIPCACALQAWTRRSQRPRQSLGRPTLLGLAAAAAIGGWWYIRNAIVCQDALGAAPGPLPFRELLGLLGEALDSYWGVFGWMNVPTPEAFYALVRVASVLGAIGVLLALAWVYWRRGAPPRYQLQSLPPVVLWVLVMALWLVWHTRLTGRPQGQLLFPAISGISFLLAVGFTGWLPRRYFGLLMSGISALLLALSLVMPSQCIAPAYQRPTRIALEEVPVTIQDLGISYGDDLFLLGYELHQDSVKPGDALRLRLYWLSRRRMHQDYSFHLRILGRGGRPIGALDTYPGLGSYPTRLWLPGDVLCDEYAILIEKDAEGPSAGVLRVGVSTGPGTAMVPALDVQGHEIGHSPQIAQVRIAPAREIIYAPQSHLQANLGRKAMLTGYDLVPSTPSAGDTWEVNLYWNALVRMARDYTVFIHLVNDAGEMVTQVDEQPLHGEYPTHLWQLGEQIKDPHQLPLPDDLPPGYYILRIGLYLLDVEERLPVIDAEPPANAVTVGPIRILAR